MKTIFLDFDGVLHVIQANFEERFSKLYLLEDLAKEFSFEVVISSVEYTKLTKLVSSSV